MIPCSKCPNDSDWLQVHSDASGRWGVRSFHFRTRIKVTGGWRRIEKGEGIPERRAILCVNCKTPLDADLTDELFLDEALQGVPLLFVAPDRVDVDRVVKEIKRIYGDAVVAVLDSDQTRAAQAVSLDSLKWLAPAARKAVEHKYGSPGKPAALYKHQADAIEAVHRGGSVVLSTATSSGKSLCFQLPFLNDIALTKDPGSRPTVLYLAPLNALVDDQFRSLGEFGAVEREAGPIGEFLQTVEIANGSARFVAAQYHGGVRLDEEDEQARATRDLRRKIRAVQPDFLFTNPEMLARAILPLAIDVTPPGCDAKRSGGDWCYLFERLRYVVLDECHEFRGVYGGHVANLIRRVQRLCALVGNTAPLRFILCSATIREPGRFAKTLTGTEPALVIDRKRDTSERYQKQLVLLRRRDPDQPIREFAKGALGLVFEGQRLSTIAFQESIPGVQSLYHELVRKLKMDGVPDDCLKVFAATFLPTEKAQNLAGLRSGQVKGVITTSALAMGIDIGSLSCATLITYPGSIAKAWQMLGRAGRKGPGLQLFLLGNSFLDRFWEDHPQEFIDQDKHLEELIVTPDNPRIVEEHVIGANYDYPLDSKVDRKWFGPAFDEVLEAVQHPDDGYLAKKKEGKKEVFVFKDGKGKRLFEIPLRGTGQFKVPVYLESKGNTKILEEDELRALRSLHPGATFLHGGKFYEVTRLRYETENRRPNAREKFYAVVQPASGREITVPCIGTEIATIEGEQRTCAVGAIKVHFGSIEVATLVDQYYRIPYEPDRLPPGEVAVAREQEPALNVGTAEKRSRFKLQNVSRDASTPAEHRYETEAAWIEVPPKAMAGIVDEGSQIRALFTVGKALVQAIPRFHYSASDDLSFTPFQTHAATRDHGAIFIYERQAGGMGLAERTYEKMLDLLHSALSEVLEGCQRCAADPNSRGCPSCVADISDLHDRRLGIQLLRGWLDQSRSAHKGTAGLSGKKPPETAKDALRAAGFSNPREIGAGGMGKVFRASKAGRVWALKVTSIAEEAAREGLAQKRLGEDFREAGFIHVEDIVRSGDWTFLQMEFADGGSLFDRIGPKGYIPCAGLGQNRAAAIVRVILPVVEVAAHLHQRGLVHRDIKPANILFVGKQPKLADYGIMHQQAQAGEYTRGAGTPIYAPPSQLKNKAQPDVRDDVYALGVVLLEMLKGRFQPKHVVALPSLTGVPAGLAKVLHKALSARRNRRQASAGDLLRELNQFLGAAGGGKSGQPKSTARPTAKARR